jgi:hypothetical protein
LKYPGRFGDDGDIIGVGCVAPIEFREAYLFIPFKLLLTLEGARRIPELKPIIEAEAIF